MNVKMTNQAIFNYTEGQKSQAFGSTDTASSLWLLLDSPVVFLIQRSASCSPTTVSTSWHPNRPPSPAIPSHTTPFPVLLFLDGSYYGGEGLPFANVQSRFPLQCWDEADPITGISSCDLCYFYTPFSSLTASVLQTS